MFYRHFICAVSMTVVTGRRPACRYVIAFLTWPVSAGKQHDDFILRFEVMALFANSNPCLRTFYRILDMSILALDAYAPLIPHTYVYTYTHT
jgi:hypothetical protein